jgi:hypothetical protein
MKNILLAVVAFIIIAGGIIYFVQSNNDEAEVYVKPTSELPAAPADAVEEPPMVDEDPEPVTEERAATTSIGTSVNGTSIVAYHFGEGDRELLLIGGIHGGYSWNTALLAYELIDWLTTSPESIPKDVRVTVIPELNPDGLVKVLPGAARPFTAAQIKATETEKIAARFNANKVDLNRNFDCKWQASGTWQNQTVSGGSAAFSEPESQAIRAYVAKNEPSAVIAWYSAAGGVYASQCEGEALTATKTLTQTFATAAGYISHEEYDYYEITGDMVNWFAGEEVPAISVLLTTHTETEFSKNKAGVEATLLGLSR